ncbi:phosphoglycerate mutase family protein [Pseudomonas fluorescens]|uniref:Phosphoglycerate mutase family protein n=1 Tax=Pseudomonas fluorescens TaxID=294 RepID=A0A3S4NVL0_PSEFL|nr:phosphoglycerate mutase family protein [Pseudomonas fluorescens]
MLSDVALSKRIMMRSSTQSWSEIYHGLMPVEIDGWQLILFNDCDTLDYCEYCKSPDGRIGALELWERDGVDPVELLSTWEREQLERLLAAL